MRGASWRVGPVIPSPPLHSDGLLRFIIERSGVRGVLVQLGDAWRSIAQRNAYPAAVRDLLGQTVAAAALFSGHSKIHGRLGIQIKGTGALRTLFSEYSSSGSLRGIALWNDPLPDLLTPRDFGRDALLAITIDTLPPGATDSTRYQGLVGLDSERLDRAFEGYFAQSEQLPTRVLLAADHDHAAGLMLQQLPGESRDVDGWTRAQALFETLGADELLGSDPMELLLRLYHEDGVRLLGTQPLRFGCSCSRERVASVLLQLGPDEALAAASGQPDQAAEIACEMCGQRYRFDRIDLGQLFGGGGSDPAAGAH
jgi:molecular chaperone Hsp33